MAANIAPSVLTCPMLEVLKNSAPSPPARKGERGKGADKLLLIIIGQCYKHVFRHELCISWDNKYVTLIFAGVISLESLSVLSMFCQNCLSGS